MMSVQKIGAKEQQIIALQKQRGSEIQRRYGQVNEEEDFAEHIRQLNPLRTPSTPRPLPPEPPKRPRPIVSQAPEHEPHERNTADDTSKHAMQEHITNLEDEVAQLKRRLAAANNKIDELTTGANALTAANEMTRAVLTAEPSVSHQHKADRKAYMRELMRKKRAAAKAAKSAAKPG